MAKYSGHPWLSGCAVMHLSTARMFRMSLYRSKFKRDYLLTSRISERREASYSSYEGLTVCAAKRCSRMPEIQHILGHPGNCGRASESLLAPITSTLTRQRLSKPLTDPRKLLSGNRVTIDWSAHCSRKRVKTPKRRKDRGAGHDRRRQR